jgi:hypothetical protein
MPNVTLDVRNFASNGSDGYTDTTASNNAIYSYLYGGGSDGHGTMNETAQSGSASFTVTVGGDPRYQISNVVFGGDIENQLSWAQGTSPTIAVITDSDTSTGSGSYSVTVTDTTAQCTLPCDPGINNQPKPPMNTGRSTAPTHAPMGTTHH